MKEKFKKFLIENGVYNAFVKNMRNDAEFKHFNVTTYEQYVGIVKDPKYFISCAFEYDSTPEGHSFWSDIDCKWLELLK